MFQKYIVEDSKMEVERLICILKEIISATNTKDSDSFGIVYIDATLYEELHHQLVTAKQKIKILKKVSNFLLLKPSTVSPLGYSSLISLITEHLTELESLLVICSKFKPNLSTIGDVSFDLSLHDVEFESDSGGDVITDDMIDEWFNQNDDDCNEHNEELINDILDCLEFE
ncbi:hypothetical protein GEMRC1_009338 [Eukaryota sp. GEM-RC1]